MNKICISGTYIVNSDETSICGLTAEYICEKCQHDKCVNCMYYLCKKCNDYMLCFSCGFDKKKDILYCSLCTNKNSNY